MQLPAPEYKRPTDSDACLGLAVEDMCRHMTDEGWQIFQGLNTCGYKLVGHRLPINTTNVSDLLNPSSEHYVPNIQTMVIQDKREWDIKPNDFRSKDAAFTNVQELKSRSDIFKLTILKDSHQRPGYHRISAEEMGVHAWIVYYDPDIVHGLAPYTRREHLIRTYHTIDGTKIPNFVSKRSGKCLLSGAISSAYPFRQRLYKAFQLDELYDVHFKPHPGYSNKGTHTYEFYNLLSNFKTMICTQSIYKYALRKIFEATACGCRVITDLQEKLPDIDDNLIRVPTDIPIKYLNTVIQDAVNGYNPEFQAHMASRAILRYDYRFECSRLAFRINQLRMNYNTLEQIGEPEWTLEPS